MRRVNGGGFPRNIPSALYIIPLVLVGIAEWYVNFSTFAAMFIPVFAISATVIVAVVFAWASHMHGAYLKQISEIIHPSVEYRNVLGRKIALIIATVFLVAAFGTVVWLRYLVISEQLGGGSGIQGGAFGGAPTSMIWSKVGPTIVLNILIWGLGTLYSWGMHEKVPGLRESYRGYSRASKAVEKKLRPFHAEERRLKAQYDREREKNVVALNQSKTLSDEVSTMKLSSCLGEMNMSFKGWWRLCCCTLPPRQRWFGQISRRPRLLQRLILRSFARGPLRIGGQWCTWM